VTAQDWDAVVRGWRETRATSLLRAYSDGANRRLLERWLPARARRLLKTDVFDEAVAGGLSPFLASRADSLVAGGAKLAASPREVAGVSCQERTTASQSWLVTRAAARRRG